MSSTEINDNQSSTETSDSVFNKSINFVKSNPIPFGVLLVVIIVIVSYTLVKSFSTETQSSVDSNETQQPKTQPPKTQPPQTQPPKTQPPQTQPPQTLPPQTLAPQTLAPETLPPETLAPTQAPTFQTFVRSTKSCSNPACKFRTASDPDSAKYNLGIITNSGYLKSILLNAKAYANNSGGNCFININITDSTEKIIKYSINFAVPKTSKLSDPMAEIDFNVSDNLPPANILIQNGDLLNLRIVGLYASTLTYLSNINAVLSLQA
jgi:hypothetical protein